MGLFLKQAAVHHETYKHLNVENWGSYPLRQNTSHAEKQDTVILSLQLQAVEKRCFLMCLMRLSSCVPLKLSGRPTDDLPPSAAD